MAETQERTIGEMIEFGINHLPEGWTLALVWEDGDVLFSLNNPDGDRCEPHYAGDDWDVFVTHVNAAREIEGMALVYAD